jgi:hypothetical protein
VTGSPLSASANAAADCQRSAGSFSSARSVASFTCGGTVFRSDMGGLGSSVMIFVKIDFTVGPVNGWRPTSIS